MKIYIFETFRLREFHSAYLANMSLTTAASFLTHRVSLLKKSGDQCDRGETEDRVHDRGRWNIWFAAKSRSLRHRHFEHSRDTRACLSSSHVVLPFLPITFRSAIFLRSFSFARCTQGMRYVGAFYVSQSNVSFSQYRTEISASTLIGLTWVIV